MEPESSAAQLVYCQLPHCTSKQSTSSDNVIFCVDCDSILCRSCFTYHDVMHSILQNVDIEQLPRITRNNQAETENILPLIKYEDLDPAPGFLNENRFSSSNATSNSQMSSSNKNSLRGFSSSPQPQNKPNNHSIVQQLQFLDEDDDDDDDDDENDFKNMIQKTIKKEEKQIEIMSISSDEDDKLVKLMMSTSNNGKAQGRSMNNGNVMQPVHNQNTLQVPSASKQYDWSNRSDTHSSNQQINNSNITSFDYSTYSNQYSNFSSESHNRSYNNNNNNIKDATPVMDRISKIGKYENQLSVFDREKDIPKNKIAKKAAKILVKKKKRLNKEEYDEEEEERMMGEEIVIPDLENPLSVQPQYDTKTLNELKNRANKLLESVKFESEMIFKEVKPHVHGVQYARDEIDRVNKYKKYVQEGVECYFLYLKDSFTLEYDKLKRCSKRNKLSRMMSKLVKVIDQFHFFREPKDFVGFLNRDFSSFFNQIKTQLKEIQNEGNDIPPTFKIKNKVAIWNSSTSDIIEITYEGQGQGYAEFQKFSNFQLVNDSDYIYCIGGQIFNEERNTFNPSSKCFKISIRTGKIIPIRDLPVPKMKFGITLYMNKIYVFGGLQSFEKHRTNTCESYDIIKDSWSSLLSMRKNRVCPIIASFTPSAESMIEEKSTIIFAFGGMEDKNNINYSFEIFDTSIDAWTKFIEKPINSKCYIPKQLGYGIQINPEQILIIGGLSGRKQKPTSGMQIYNVSKNSITNLSLDSLPTGIIQDYSCGHPVVYNKSIYLLNTQISQYFPVLKQLQGICNIIKIGLNQQEIICTHSL